MSGGKSAFLDYQTTNTISEHNLSLKRKKVLKNNDNNKKNIARLKKQKDKRPSEDYR